MSRLLVKNLLSKMHSQAESDLEKTLHQTMLTKYSAKITESVDRIFSKKIEPHVMPLEHLSDEDKFHFCKIIRPFCSNKTIGYFRSKAYDEILLTKLTAFKRTNPILQLLTNPNTPFNVAPDWLFCNRSNGKLVYGYNFITICANGYQRYLARELVSKNDPNSLLVLGIVPKTLRINTQKYDLFKTGIDNNQIVFTGRLEQALSERLL